MTDSTVTALDYIQRQEELEKEAKEVLPGKFEKCTFPLGYIRQPLYACKTCQTDDNTPAAMCYSCSMACHPEHELYELFPKRHFRCDCGLVDKFNNHPCALMIPAKKIIKANTENKYNHNFHGRYCRCDEIYDPENEDGTMFQCIVCEDWFHERCIGNIPEAIEDFDCYICRHCTKKYPFLIQGKDRRFSIGLSKGNEAITTWVLPDKIISSIEQSTQAQEETAKCDASAVQTNMKGTNDMSLPEAEPKQTTNVGKEALQEDTKNMPVKIGEKRKLDEDTLSSVQTKRLKGNGCANVDLSSLPENDNVEIFLQETWREGLCRCEECLRQYKESDLEFLLAEEQTYEPEEDEDAGKSLLEIGMEQLQRIDRVKVLESLMAYKDLAADLKNYFASFKDSGKVVTKEDIDEFFSAKLRERNND
ncbi:hypothetical protein RMCBS344292_01315 [Rhizopus microsporus]|nr:hypothetical protein RMCBS344292_01315 [Rhizopus microsporus]